MAEDAVLRETLVLIGHWPLSGSKGGRGDVARSI